MKKAVSLLVTLATLLTMTACGKKAEKSTAKSTDEKSHVEEVIAKASKMSENELEAAAKSELEASGGAKFNADSLTSGIKKGLASFEKKYPWIKGNVTYNSKKGSEYQPKLVAAQQANNYIADFVMIQDGSFLKNAMIDTGFLLSYTPTGDGFEFAEGDKNPQVGVIFNKVFMFFNKKVGADQLKNVWQMTGVDGKELKGLHNVSFQSPLGEDINMNFLVMLTSPRAVEKLTSAYKNYFGKEYNPADDKTKYENIGYKFVAEFIKNVGFWHSSDTKEIKGLSNYEEDGRIVFAGLNKLKDFEYNKDKYKDSDLYYTKTVTASGWNQEVEGFDGFVYNMWMLIPKTAKLPYTSCLFIRYMLSDEGFKAGFNGRLGYYSANKKLPTFPGDPSVEEWKEKCLVEDIEYIDSNYTSIVKFINMQLAGK